MNKRHVFKMIGLARKRQAIVAVESLVDEKTTALSIDRFASEWFN